MATNICRAGPGLMNSIRTSPPHLKFPRQLLAGMHTEPDSERGRGEPDADDKAKKTRALHGRQRRGQGRYTN